MIGNRKSGPVRLNTTIFQDMIQAYRAQPAWRRERAAAMMAEYKCAACQDLGWVTVLPPPVGYRNLAAACKCEEGAERQRGFLASQPKGYPKKILYCILHYKDGKHNHACRPNCHEDRYRLCFGHYRREEYGGEG